MTDKETPKTMKKVIVTFEVSEGKTEVIATGSNGNVEKIDISGTDIEKKFTKLLKSIMDYKLEQQILDAIDSKKFYETR